MIHAHVDCNMSKAHTIVFRVSFASIIFRCQAFQSPLEEKVYVGSHFLYIYFHIVPSGLKHIIMKRTMKKGCKKLARFLAALLCVIPSTGLYAKNALKFKVKNAEGYSITYEVKEGTNGLVSVTDAKVKKRSTLRIPETVEYEGQTYIVVEIADRAFATNKNQGLPFRAVELPSTIRRIGKYAFQWCNNLESINLPEGLLIIDVLAFAYTYNLKQLSIPSSVINIGDMALQKDLKRIREEAAQNGITITPSKWETAELNP